MSEKVPWPVVLTMLSLTLVSTWLVFLRGWVAWDAMFTVGAAAIVAIAGLTGTALLLVNRKNRTEI